MRAKASIPYNIVVSALLTLIFFFATHKVYHLPFSYGDDHRALAMLHPDKVSESYKMALYGNTPDLKGCFAIDSHIGRFRPLTWSYDKLLCLICGDNTYLFRLSNLLILFLSSFFLLCIFTCFEVDGLSAFIVLVIYVFGRNNETWWTLIPPPQNIGECLLLAGIYCWLRLRKKGITGFYVLPALLFFLAGISKESFIFCIPVLLIADYLFFNSTKQLLAKEYWLSILACFLPFMGLLLTVLHSGQVYSYSYPEPVWAILTYNIFQFVGAAIFFLAPAVLLIINRKAFEKNFLVKLLTVLVTWTAIQLFLLKGIKLNDQHHYLIPWLIYPLVLTAIAFSELRKISAKWFKYLFFIYGLAALIFLKNTSANSTSYAASLQGYYAMIDAIKADTSAREVVYLSENPCLGDWINGTKIIMDNKDIKKELIFATTATSIPAWEKDYAAHSPQYAFRHMSLDSVFYPNGKWIILVENPSKNGFISDSLSLYKKNDTSYIQINGRERRIPGKYYYFSVAYPGRSIGDILKRNFAAENRKGFYAIKMNART